MRYTIALLSLACGCAQVPPKPAPTDLRARFDSMRSQDGRERGMNHYWQNRRYSELVATLGQPRMLLNIPGGGSPPGFVAVYPADPVTGCIDAFAMVYGADPTVRAYYCR